MFRNTSWGVFSTVLTLGISSFASGLAQAETEIPLAEMDKEALKAEILTIATLNNQRRDNLVEVREQLDPLVEQLAKFSMQQDAIMDLPLLEGAWKEVWADDIEPEPPGFSVERDLTFQVVTDKGYFYNMSQLNGVLRTRFSAFLRGEYTDSGEYLRIQFTDVGIRLGGLGNEQNLVNLAEMIESKEIGIIDLTGQSQAPNGPIGASGFIKNIYIDENLRIATGFNNADGIQDLFVLTRVTGAERYQD